MNGDAKIDLAEKGVVVGWERPQFNVRVTLVDLASTAHGRKPGEYA